MNFKKYAMLLLALVLAIGCSQEGLEEADSLNLEMQTPQNRASDVAVCHQNGKGEWTVLYVSANAVTGHVNHGDVVFVDNDGDGYAAEASDCFPGGDCDDEDASVYPGAEEICGDSIDNDCDGEIDEGCMPTYSCPCFSYAEALNYAQATAIEYKDEVCTMGAKGFTSTSGPFWGVTDLFFSKYCTDFNGNLIMLSPSQVAEGKMLLQAVQAEVQAAYCGN